MKRWFVIIIILCLWSIPLTAQILDETPTDYLGYYQLSGHTNGYQTVVQQNGGKVVNLQADTSFFVLWVPQSYSSLKDKRLIVCVHGTAGTGYDETRDELTNAKANNYAIIGIQWLVFNPSNGGTYFAEEKVYRLIDVAIKHLVAKYGADPQKVAYKGFSRGSLIGYEVAQLDRSKGTNYFAMMLELSGGQSPKLTPGKYDRTAFMDKLERGEYGTKPLLGTNFFLYSGMKDEQWDTLQCYFMRYTDSTIRKYGANVVRLVQDPNGKHAGFQANAGYQASALQYFFALTSTPTPPALVLPTDKAVNISPQAVSLQWSTNASAAVFDVQASSDAAFTKVVLRDSLLAASTTSRTLANLAANTTYYWRVRSKNNIGTSVWSDVRSFTTQAMTGVANNEADNRTGVRLKISPNPAQGFVTVHFTLLKSERILLNFFNTLGQEVAHILDSDLASGEHSFPVPIPPFLFGTVFLRLQTSTFSHTQPVQVLR